MKPLRPTVYTVEDLWLPLSQGGLIHTGRDVHVGKICPVFILIKTFHTEYGSQDTDFTMLNLNNVSIICKLNMQLSSLKCLDKKHEAIKCLADVLPVTKHYNLFYQHGVCSVAALVLPTAGYTSGPDIKCLLAQTTYIISPQ